MLFGIIPSNWPPTYIKKEEAKNLLNKERRIRAVGLIFFSIVFAAVNLFILHIPEIKGYNHIWPPISASQMPYIIGVVNTAVFLFGIYLLVTKPNYTKTDVTLSKYKDDAMISFKEVSDKGVSFYIFSIALVALFALLLLSIIAPKA